LQGERSLPDTIDLVKIKTRQFAKRQMTWFRRQLQVPWLCVDATDIPSAVAQRLLEAYGQLGEEQQRPR
jgi:tRNA dimethylallyltransferase